MNAIYDAPTDQNGKAIFNHLQRTDFFNFGDEIETPFLIWGAKNDWVVDYKANTGRWWKQHQGQHPFVQTLSADYGNHCASSISYGWQTASSTYRGFFLSHSPAYLAQRERRQRELSLPAPRLAPSEVHVGQIWQATAASHKLKLTYATWDGERYMRSCLVRRRNSGGTFHYVRDKRDQNPFTSRRKCYLTYSHEVPISAFADLGLSPPGNAVEAEALTRWLNNNIEIRSGRQPLVNTAAAPTSVVYYIEKK